MKWDTGKNILECISGKVETFLKFADDGSSFVYGFVATGYSDENITLQGTFAFGVSKNIYLVYNSILLDTEFRTSIATFDLTVLLSFL